MRIRVTVEFDVNSQIAAKGYKHVKTLLTEFMDSWSGTFKPVFLSVEKVDKKAPALV